MGRRGPGDGAWWGEAGKEWPRPTGLRLLIPGYPQWAWRQRDRAVVLLGSFAASIAVGAFAWGTKAGLVVLAFAFATHAFSAADAIRQHAFPGFGRIVPAASASASLGAFCYGPALAIASVFAWPICPDDRPRDGYLVNRWAYRNGEAPAAGEVVWLAPSRWFRPRVARVIAGPNQRVEWSDGELTVEDRPSARAPFVADGSPSRLSLSVPDGHVLVGYGFDRPGERPRPGDWEFVDRAEIRGRAWAQSYPIARRQLFR